MKIEELAEKNIRNFMKKKIIELTKKKIIEEMISKTSKTDNMLLHFKFHGKPLQYLID